MRTDRNRSSDAEQWRLDRVAITAAVTMLYGPAARVRSITLVGGDREAAWVRQGRLSLRTSQRPPALARTGPPFDRGRS